MIREDVYGFSPKEAEREKRRQKKRRPGMIVSGRSVIGLAQIIAKRAQQGSKKK